MGHLNKITFPGEVSPSGKLKIFDNKGFIADLHLFSGRYVDVTIEVRRKRRSILQNSYYWGCIIPFVRDGLRDAGYKFNREQTHDFIRNNFLTEELINEDTGEIIRVPDGVVAKRVKSTTELSTTEFMDFIAEVQMWSAEMLNVIIPDPGEQMNIEFES